MPISLILTPWDGYTVTLPKFQLENKGYTIRSLQEDTEPHNIAKIGLFRFIVWDFKMMEVLHSFKYKTLLLEFVNLLNLR